MSRSTGAGTTWPFAEVHARRWIERRCRGCAPARVVAPPDVGLRLERPWHPIEARGIDPYQLTCRNPLIDLPPESCAHVVVRTRAELQRLQSIDQIAEARAMRVARVGLARCRYAAGTASAGCAAGRAAAESSSYADNASAAYMSEGPPPMYTATASASSISARVAPNRMSAFT